MIPVRSVVPCLLFVAALACQSTPDTPAPPPAPPDSGTGIGLFTIPSQGLHVEPDLPLGELLARYASAMGWSLLVPEAAREKLTAKRCQLGQPLDVPPGSVHGLVESLVRTNGLLLRFEHTSAPVVLQVVDPDDKEQGDIPAHRVLVPLAEVPRWEAHPAHMITTQIPLPAGDAPDLVRSLRAVFGDAARGLVQQVGETNSLLVSGPGSEVARLARTIEAATHGPDAHAIPLASVERPDLLKLMHVPAKGLYLEDPSGKGIALDKLVEQYAQVMGWELLFPIDERNKASLQRFQGPMPIDVPPENVQLFVEAVLRANDFVLAFAHASEPVVLEVRRPDSTSLRGPGASAIEIEPAEIPRWAGHTAFVVRTVLNLPGVDVRAVGNSLRMMLSDVKMQAVHPIGTDGLVVSGYADEVASLSRILRLVVDGVAGHHAPGPVEFERASAAGLFVMPPKGLHLEVPERTKFTLATLVESYAQVMGWRTLVSQDTRNYLTTTQGGLALPIDVPAENVHAFVEGVLRANGFVLNFAHTTDPVLLQIVSTYVAGQANPRSHAILVPPAELARWAPHPDFLVSTVLDLPGIDVRTLSNSLRQVFSDQQTQQIIPMGNTDGLLVTGFGSDVANLAEFFIALSDPAPGARLAPPPPAKMRSLLELLAPPQKSLDLPKPPANDSTLADLCDQYAQLMGWRIIAGPDTRMQLRTLKGGLDLPQAVAPEHVHEFVQSVLRANDFVMSFAHAQDPVLLQITSTNVAGKGNPRQDAEIVPAAELNEWAKHPDILITTCFDLSGVDVRTLSNSMRQMFSDQQTQQIIPVGNTDGLIVTGFGSDVAAIAAMLQPLVEAARGVHVEVPRILGARSGIDLFAVPAKGLHLEKPERRELKLLDVFTQYAQLMGWHLLLTPDTRNQLVTLTFPLELPLDVPPQTVHSFIEGIARTNDFVFTFAHVSEPILLQVASTNVAGRGSLRKDARQVPVAELPRWADHPAYLIATTVDLPGIDVRVLSNDMQKQLADPRTQLVAPIGNTDGLALAGFGPEVARIVADLGEKSRKALAERPPTAPAAPAVLRARLFPQGIANLTFEVRDGHMPTPIAVLDAFSAWSQRPLEISAAARAALESPAGQFATPEMLRAELVHAQVGLLLEHAGCTLLPSPAEAPTKWVIDLAGPAREKAPQDWPLIELEDLTAWGAYCATPFRAHLQLPTGMDPLRAQFALALLHGSRSRGLYITNSDRVVLLWGTTREIQTAAGVIRQACEQAPPGR